MTTFVRLTIVFTILLFACNVWAQGIPQCPLNPNVPWPVPLPPDSPGACFFDGTGVATIFYVLDGERLLGVLSFGTGENDFFRFNPNLKAFWHMHDKGGTAAALCTDWPNCGVDEWGWPNDATWFEGEVTIKVNSRAVATDLGFYSTCPFNINVKGQLADDFGEGNKIDMLALTTVVPDHEQDLPGCRISMTSIKIDPID
jgi:hypothetical protein